MRFARYNRQKVDGAQRTVVMDLGGGLNEVLPPTHIRDGQLSASRNFLTEDGITLQSVPCTPLPAPMVFPAGVRTLALATYNGKSSKVLPSFYGNKQGVGTILQSLCTDAIVYDVSSNDFKVDVTSGSYGAVEYITQASTRSIYWSSSMNKLLVQDQSSKTITTQDLPANVYPVSLVSHRTRLFLLDKKNTLWWCRAGDIGTWFGDSPDGEYVAEDAGFWFVDAGQSLTRLAALGESLYVFGENVIYRFSGYSPETFVLQRLLDGLGTGAERKRTVAIANGCMYFTYGYDVYEYNGMEYPRLVSRPEISNGSVRNGITGGIRNDKWYGVPATDYQYWEYVSLFSDNENIFLYPRLTDMAVTVLGVRRYSIPLYVFNAKQQSWWMADGAYFESSLHAVYYNTLFVYPALEPDGSITYGATIKYTPTGGDVYASMILSNRSYKQTNGSFLDITADPVLSFTQGYEAYLVSKAFSTSLDDEFYLYEVDVHWRYTGAIGARAFELAVDICDASGFPYTRAYKDNEDYTAPLPSTYRSTLVSCVDDNSWTASVKSNGFVTPPNPSHTAWQTYPHKTRFYYDPTVVEATNNKRRTGFAQLYIRAKYESVQIDRVELKYRRIGASR